MNDVRSRDVQVGMTSANRMDVYNLKPGDRYKFRVTARNRFGWGRAVATADYVDVSEPKRLPEFRRPLPGETKVLSRHSATLQCHVSFTDIVLLFSFDIKKHHFGATLRCNITRSFAQIFCYGLAHARPLNV